LDSAERIFRVRPQAIDQRNERALMQRTELSAHRDAPRLEFLAVREFEIVEELAAERVDEFAQPVDRQPVGPARQRRAHLERVDVDARRFERDARAICTDPLYANIVECA
jgi:hypothetical protein